MSNLYKQYRTDSNLETSGIFLNYGPNSHGDPMRIRIARAGGANKAFSKALERITRPHRRAIQTGTLSNDLADSLMKEAFAETVVLGWENIEGPEGEILDFTKENVIRVLDDLPDLYADLREQANNVALFREAILDDDLGNSGL